MNRAEILALVDYERAVDLTVEGLAAHPSPGSLISYEFGCRIGSDAPDRVDPMESASLSVAFRKFLRVRATELVEATLDRLAAELREDDGTICLYRGLYVDRSWLDSEITEQPIGLCWSWDYDFAIAHRGHLDEGDDPIDLRVIGLVDIGDVDWTRTVSLGAADLYVTGEEREVRLLPDAMVEIAGMDWKEAESETDYLPDQRFETCGFVVPAGAVPNVPVPI